MLKIYLLGPLRVVDAGGSDITPLGKKTQGVLALLAKSPGHRRARSWIQDKLWSDRGPTQGAASLRQCLTEIRKAFGANSDVLCSANGFLSLDTKAFKIFDAPQESASGAELFEGLDDIRDAEFEHWLRDIRAEHIPAATQNGSSHVAGAPMPTLVLLEEPQQERSELLFAADFNGQVSHSLQEAGNIVMLLFLPKPVQQDTIVLSTRCLMHGTDWHVEVRLTDGRSDRLLWRAGRRIAGSGHIPLESLEVRELVRQAVTAVLDHCCRASYNGSPAGQAFLAQKLIFSLDSNHFIQAEHLLSEAYSREPRATYLAWKSFLRLTRIVEERREDPRVLQRDALELIDLALREEPNNSTVLALAAQARLLVEEDPTSCLHLARRSIDLDPSNPMAWGYHALGQVHVGKAKDAHLSALRARYLAQSSPFVFWWDMLCCVTACNVGEFEKAIDFAEKVRAIVPAYKPALRYLYPLYRANRQFEQADKALLRLRDAEPGFDPESYENPNYPVSTLRKTRLIEHV
ncbi:hypothetical protein [uncultured Tateyamaria sp.]|uniref:hypothetical protein n=1 Tax=uncultured Tateyamaria sp. TaxID=455651 RepID=UPI0026164B9B|nr:hypothetical protein [uncultured Tateyamaria sp.]